MKLTVNGRQVESLAITLTGADGASSTHDIAPDALVRALAGELGLSMREVSITYTTPERPHRRRAPESSPQDLLDTMGDLLSVQEAALVLGVNGRTVTRLCHKGEIPAIRVASLWRIPKARLRKYMEV